MTDSSTSQDTGTTVADAADRIASLLGPADSETDETRDEESSAEETEVDPEGEIEVDPEGSDEPEETDEADEQPELYTVKVAGEEVQVTLEEALKGYSREQDYTRKTQALAEEAKAKEREIAAARDEYLTGLQTVQQIIESAQPKVDQSLRFSNPAEWSAQMLQHQQWAEQKRAVTAETERLKGERAEIEARERDALVKAETAKLLKAMPEWENPEVAKAETAKLREYGQAAGYTEEELDEVVDHRALKVLRDAMRYRELVAKSGKVKATVEQKRVAKPGAASAPPSKAQDLTRAKQRLRQSGRVDDAASAIERMMS